MSTAWVVAEAGYKAGADQDFQELFCGEQIGEGVGRKVYIFALDPAKVVKVETSPRSFQNITEWQTWQDLAHTKYAKFLAPCHSISPNGTVLIQSRVTPLTEGVEAKVPDFLTDFQRDNFGMLDGRVVCCDYGLNLLLNHGAYSSKLVKPDWWR